MINEKKLGLIGLIVAAILGTARAGKLEILNYTPKKGIFKQQVLMRDNDTDSSYFEPPYYPALISYIYDPNSSCGPYLNGKGINSRNTNAIKIDLDSESVPMGTEHFIRVRILPDPETGIVPIEDYTKRNLTLYQEPNDPNADPNLYDIKDLTNLGTEYGYINLPTFEPAQWIFRSDNYADLDFSGNVGLEDFAIFADSWLRTDCNSVNHWCGYADLNRSGSVGFDDYALFGNEWLYDTNDPNTW